MAKSIFFELLSAPWGPRGAQGHGAPGGTRGGPPGDPGGGAPGEPGGGPWGNPGGSLGDYILRVSPAGSEAWPMVSKGLRIKNNIFNILNKSIHQKIKTRRSGKIFRRLCRRKFFPEKKCLAKNIFFS